MGDDLLAPNSQSEAALALRLVGKTLSRARDALWQRNVNQAPCHARLAHERNPLTKTDIRDDVAAVIMRTVPLHAPAVQKMLCGMGCHASCSEIHGARRRLRPDLFTKQKDRQVASAAAAGGSSDTDDPDREEAAGSRGAHTVRSSSEVASTLATREVASQVAAQVASQVAAQVATQVALATQVATREAGQQVPRVEATQGVESSSAECA